MKRDLIAVIWSLLVTGGISKWAFHVAYLERGYKAVGGEYLNFECKQGYKKRNLEGLYSIHRLDGEQAD